MQPLSAKATHRSRESEGRRGEIRGQRRAGGRRVDFPSEEAFGRTQTEVPRETNKAIQADIANYSQKPPVIWLADIKATM